MHKNEKIYDLVINIGRFQPVHNGHMANFKHSAKIGKHVVAILGSMDQARTPVNPFIFSERKEMLQALMPSIIVRGVRDYLYNNNTWISQVNAIVDEEVKNLGLENPKIAIMGYEKDETSWYIRAFPQWTFESIGGYCEVGGAVVDATRIRQLYFQEHFGFLKGVVPDQVYDWLMAFSKTEHFVDMQQEQEFYATYKKQWSFAPYPVQFNTVDAVVVQGGHVLLIQRKAYPGRGLWALPGGFVNPNETCVDGMIRELREETKIKVPEVVLRSSITHEKLFDHPDRSLRGRTFTMAYLIELVSGDASLPKVKGSDDAAVAKWFTENEVMSMSDQLFDDHFSILSYMFARTK